MTINIILHYIQHIFTLKVVDVWKVRDKKLYSLRLILDQKVNTAKKKGEHNLCTT